MNLKVKIGKYPPPFLVLDCKKAFHQYAKAANKHVDELTLEDRQIVYLNYVIENAEEAFNNLDRKSSEGIDKSIS